MAAIVGRSSASGLVMSVVGAGRRASLALPCTDPTSPRDTSAVRPSAAGTRISPVSHRAKNSV
jgi:hypothetical protein